MSEPTSGVPGLDPETLERLRRGVPLRLSAMGDFRFDGEPVSHPRVQQALRRGLDLTPEGEPIVRLGAQWCYLTVDDLPLRVTRIEEHDGRLVALLNDKRQVALDLDTLWEEPDRGLRCEVPSTATGSMIPARLTNAAQMDLSPWLEFEGDTPILRLDSRTVRLDRPVTRPTDE